MLTNKLLELESAIPGFQPKVRSLAPYRCVAVDWVGRNSGVSTDVSTFMALCVSDYS